MSVKKRRRFLRKNNLILILAICLVVIGIFLLIENEFIENPFTSREPVTIEARDFCSLIAGNVLHTINNGDECRLQCLAQCETRDMSLGDSEFNKIENDCNTCSCYCE